MVGGCSSVWLERSPVTREVASSSLVSPAIFLIFLINPLSIICPAYRPIQRIAFYVQYVILKAILILNLSLGALC